MKCMIGAILIVALLYAIKLTEHNAFLLVTHNDVQNGRYPLH